MGFLYDTPGNCLDEPALVSDRGSLSHRGLLRDAEKTARKLVTVGVEPGETVAVKGHPTPEVVTALHGIWLAGGVAAPLHPAWTREEESRALGLLEPALVLSEKGETVPGGSPGLGILTLASGHEDDMASLTSHRPDTASLDMRPGSRRGCEAALRLLTSGTSGTPSVVTLTYGNLVASARGVGERLSLHPSDRWLASLALAHVGGAAMVVRSALVGSALVLAGRFRGDLFHRLVNQGAVTHASLVPTMLSQFMAIQGEDPVPRTLRCLLVGGASAEEALVRTAHSRGLPVALTYGMTEASSQAATAPPELVARKPCTVGPPLPGVEIALSEDGEIRVSGDTVSPGCRDEEGWYRTGDLGRFDEEGHLRILGRISHRIISGGVNVDPAEVEALLRTHPGVLEAAVVGIPDPKWGERVVAAVAVGDGAEVSLSELEGLSRTSLSPAKRPKEYALIPSLPRNTNGKVDRKRIRDLFL